MTFCSGGPRPSDKGAVPGRPDPEIWGSLIKNFFFSALRASVWYKNKGRGEPPRPLPGSTTVLVTRPDSPPLSYGRLVLVNVACVFN